MLLDKVKDRDVFLWYAELNGEAGWAVDALKEQIGNGLYERQVLTRKASNFQQRLKDTCINNVFFAKFYQVRLAIRKFVVLVNSDPVQVIDRL